MPANAVSTPDGRRIELTDEVHEDLVSLDWTTKQIAEFERAGATVEVEGKLVSRMGTLIHLREQQENLARGLRSANVWVCRVCFCSDLNACSIPGPEASVSHCHWVGPKVCSNCVEEDLEARYVATVLTLGLTIGGGPMVASAARAGDVIVRHGKEERIVEATWDGATVPSAPNDDPAGDDSTVVISTPTTTWTLAPAEPVTYRAVPKSQDWKDLLDPELAEPARRRIILAAFRAEKYVDRERAEALLELDLETGEVLDG